MKHHCNVPDTLLWKSEYLPEFLLPQIIEKGLTVSVTEFIHFSLPLFLEVSNVILFQEIYFGNCNLKKNISVLIILNIPRTVSNILHPVLVPCADWPLYEDILHYNCLSVQFSSTYKNQSGSSRGHVQYLPSLNLFGVQYYILPALPNLRSNIAPAYKRKETWNWSLKGETDPKYLSLYHPELVISRIYNTKTRFWPDKWWPVVNKTFCIIGCLPILSSLS